MRVAVFFDGKNFYENLERARGGRHHLDYGALTQWLVERVNGNQLTGAHYYTGIPDRLDPESPEYGQLRGLMRFLESLEYVEGFFVYRFPRVRRMTRCPACGVSTSYTEEKEVDTSMVADMIRFAAGDAFDVLVLASGDADHAPAVEAVRAMGKVVYLASWGDEALSPRLRRAAYGHVDLLRECPPEILGEKVLAALSGDEVVLDEQPAEIDPDVAAQVLAEIIRAVGYFEDHGGYLGRGYFIHRWRGLNVPSEVETREAILDYLVETTAIEEVQILGETAIKIRQDPTQTVEQTLSPQLRKTLELHANNDTIPLMTDLIPDPPNASTRKKKTEKLKDDPDPDWIKKTLEQHVFTDEMLRSAWDSLRRAEVHFRYRGFVGRGYFLTRWRDANLPQDVNQRERLLTRLIELGVVEQYSIDGSTALRTIGKPEAAEVAVQ